MTLVLMKKKVAAEAPAEVSEIAQLVDRIGEMMPEVAQITMRAKAETAKLKPYQDAMKELQALVDAKDEGDDAVFTEKGVSFEVVAGPRGNQRSISDLDGIKKMLGTELFMKLAKVTLGDIDSYLNPEQKLKVLKTDRTGRGMKIGKRS